MNYNPQLVLTLRQFGEQLRENGMDNLLYFTPGPEANRFVQQPNPFLIGVLFDQNIAAEMAWAAPYRLYQRLGHLDIERIAAMSAEGLSEIITRFPALHRYVRQMGLISWCWPSASRFNTVGMKATSGAIIPPPGFWRAGYRNFAELAKRRRQ